MKFLIISIYFTLFFLVMGVVGSMDFQDAVEAEEFYCDMVREGTYPHYNKEINCD
jgi:hypothetical protein